MTLNLGPCGWKGGHTVCVGVVKPRTKNTNDSGCTPPSTSHDFFMGGGGGGYPQQVKTVDKSQSPKGKHKKSANLTFPRVDAKILPRGRSRARQNFLKCDTNVHISIRKISVPQPRILFSQVLHVRVFFQVLQHRPFPPTLGAFHSVRSLFQR